MNTIKSFEIAQCRNCACLNVRKAARAITQSYDAALQPVGLRATQFSLLVIAQARGEVSISQAAELMVMDRTTLTRNLKPLQKRSLIVVNPGKDRRTKAIVITDEGRALLQEALPLWKAVQQEVVEGFGGERFESLLTDLKTLVELNRTEA